MPNALTEQRSRLLAALSPAVRHGSGPLAQIIREGRLHCVFQPLGDLQSGHVFAHEALIRGPIGSSLHRPDALLEMARCERILNDFELACVFTALQQWTDARSPGRLFVNISADALVQGVALCGTRLLSQTLRSLGILPRMLVLEITEHERVSDMLALREAVKQVHAAGMRLALDDFGDGRSSLRLWSEVRPDYVKIDKYFISDITEHPENLQMLRAIKGIADMFGTHLVAEGIETQDDLRALRDLDIPYGQGWLLGRPAEHPLESLDSPALEVMRDRRVAVLPHLQQSARPGILRGLQVVPAPTVTPSTSNDTVAELFMHHSELHALCLVEDDRPVALINRHDFLNHYAALYFREVHGRKPCTTLANHAPRIVELDCDVNQLIGILTSPDQRYLSDGFIVTDNGRYVGLGTGDKLVRAVTESRIEAARHANPLTFLPGNIPISMHIARLIESGNRFVACYADLNHFKPFNDHYGYWRGDEMICLAARLIVAHCDARRDFVGHVGGDDFLVLFQSGDWLQRSQRIVDAFAREARALYDDTGRQAGGIHAEDRHGVQRFFPLTTLSIGVAPIAPGVFRNAEEVANLAARAKHEAKLAPGGIAVLHCTEPADDRTHCEAAKPPRADVLVA